MKIGITCHAAAGGSGILATQLGIALANRGHEIHFVAYDPPFRLSHTRQRPRGAEKAVTGRHGPARRQRPVPVGNLRAVPCPKSIDFLSDELLVHAV